MTLTRSRACPIAAAVVLLAAGCQGTGDIDLRDAASEPALDAAPDEASDPTPGDGEPDCEPENTPTGSEGHQAGEDCMACHASMSGPTRWTVAGTLYSDASGSSPVSGATIIVNDAAGATLRLVTHPNGNFYTNEAVELPLSVAASLCPDSAEMLSSASSGCNSCHDSSFRVHLP
ncbi:MAG: hypothetical protein JRG91_00850 [Deltaproteobacteria bacterium]|nr:hypothetical protein [Deltaproteobacteria bacterium]